MNPAAGAPMTAQALGHRTVRPVPEPAQPAHGSVQALAQIRLAPYLSRHLFEAHLRAIPAVRSAAHVIGDVDYEVRLVCRDLADLRVVLSSLRGCRGTHVVSPALVLGDVEGLSRRARSIPDRGTAPRSRETRSA
jgi:hypothetical protein